MQQEGLMRIRIKILLVHKVGTSVFHGDIVVAGRKFWFAIDGENLGIRRKEELIALEDEERNFFASVISRAIKLKQNHQHEEVLELVENLTRVDDSPIVINLTVSDNTLRFLTSPKFGCKILAQDRASTSWITH